MKKINCVALIVAAVSVLAFGMFRTKIGPCSPQLEDMINSRK